MLTSLLRRRLPYLSSMSTIPRLSPLPIPLLLLLRLPFRSLSSVQLNEDSSTFSLLTASLGLSPETALSVFRKLPVDRTANAGPVISFFMGRGFSADQICTMVKRCPPLLQEKNPERTLLPKLEFFGSKGLTGTDLAKFVSSQPHILRRSLERCIIPNFDLFRSMLKSDEITLQVTSRTYRSGCLDNTIIPNVKYLRDNGVSELVVVALLRHNTLMLLSSQARLREAVRVVKEMGVDPEKTTFRHALMAMLGMSKSSWESKVTAYRSRGWSEEELLTAFRKFPVCMSTSVDKINRVMGLLVDRMGWKPSLIAENPMLLTQSLEKKTIPRASVLRFLISEGLVKKHMSLVQFLTMNEKAFMKRVSGYPEEIACRIMAIYKDGRDGTNRDDDSLYDCI